METTAEIPVSFTPGAVTEIRRLMAQASFDQSKQLRIGVKGGGCSGLSYVLGFEQRQENDEEYNFDGLAFIMNRAHGIYLSGMEITWEDGLNSRGFMFNNPNASKTCGCGTSFAV
jgi:iron-sulfur cluster assembly accessory protein